MKTKKRPRTAIIPSAQFFRLSLTLVSCFALILASCQVIQAEKPKQKSSPKDYALIFGTVWGPDDRPVHGVPVKIRRAGDKKAKWEVYSNGLGEFEQAVPVGRQDYVIWPDLKGYRSPFYKHLQPGPEVTVHIESNERVDTGLHLK
ncbi:MAG TPA: hypothetical protein VJ731_06640 [Terriglobales bacterium]|nr:hypothetical protein [Terriglobales bacterium]